MTNRAFSPLPGRALLADMPVDLPAKELLTNVKGGPLVVLYRQLFHKFGIQPRGVIHLGANVGQEALVYLLLGYQKVIFVEPAPDSFAKLRANLAFVEKIAVAIAGFVGERRRAWGRALQLAAGDRNGTTRLYVQPDHSQANSILKPIAGSMEHILREHAEEVEVPLRTVDSFMAELEGEWKPTDFNVLYANVEGAELLALRGAVATLKHIEFAFVEVNLKRHYEGDPTADELEDFMRSQGFRLGWSCGGLVPDTGYLVFVR